MRRGDNYSGPRWVYSPHDSSPHDAPLPGPILEAPSVFDDDIRESDSCGHRECADADGHIDDCLYDFVDEQLEPEGQ